ncbi:MAG: MBL fold metallo-hydrolase, partial [Bacteroidetes bacterium]|nr:MBL fold metallo-hydrolase [Bacteroidota bacterium]
MQIKQFEDKGLSQFSYVVFCENEGIAAVVDPQRDVDGYISFAKENNLTIKYIFETHIHADFASGIRELEALTKATLKLSSYDTNETFEYAFPHDALKDGDAVTFGSVKIEAVHTPGHTPEHLSFLVYDVNRDAAQPSHFLSGDFLFLGSLGRPDLLGEDAKLALAK